MYDACVHHVACVYDPYMYDALLNPWPRSLYSWCVYPSSSTLDTMHVTMMHVFVILVTMTHVCMMRVSMVHEHMMHVLVHMIHVHMMYECMIYVCMMHVCMFRVWSSDKLFRILDFFLKKLLWGPRRSKSHDFWYYGPWPTIFWGWYFFGTPRPPLYVWKCSNVLNLALSECPVKKITLK